MAETKLAFGAVFISLAAVAALSYWLLSAIDDPVLHARLNNIPPAVGSLVGPFLGLIALMLGALYNAKLNRDRDDRLREHDIKSLSAAFANEIFSVCDDIAGIDAYVESLRAENNRNNPDRINIIRAQIQLFGSFDVFEANLNRLDLLDPDLTAGVLRFYRIARRITERAAKSPMDASPMDPVENDLRRIVEALGTQIGSKLRDRARLSPEDPHTRRVRSLTDSDIPDIASVVE